MWKNSGHGDMYCTICYEARPRLYGKEDLVGVTKCELNLLVLVEYLKTKHLAAPTRATLSMFYLEGKNSKRIYR